MAGTGHCSYNLSHTHSSSIHPPPGSSSSSSEMKSTSNFERFHDRFSINNRRAVLPRNVVKFGENCHLVDRGKKKTNLGGGGGGGKN